VELGRERFEGCRHNREVSRTAGGERPIDALGAAQAKFADRVLPGGEAYAGCFGGDERLKIDEIEQWGLQQLRLQNRAMDSNQWLVREDHRAFAQLEITSES